MGGLEKPIERPVAVEPERVVVNPEYIKAGPEADVEVIVHPKVGVSVSTLPPAIQAVLGRVKAPAAPDLARPQG